MNTTIEELKSIKNILRTNGRITGELFEPGYWRGDPTSLSDSPCCLLGAGALAAATPFPNYPYVGRYPSFSDILETSSGIQAIAEQLILEEFVPTATRDDDLDPDIVYEFNDAIGTSDADVYALIDRTIARLEQTNSDAKDSDEKAK